MRLLWVLIVVAVAGCQAGEAEFARSPYGMRHAPVGDGKPVAVPGEPGFYSYLPVVMAGGVYGGGVSAVFGVECSVGGGE